MEKNSKWTLFKDQKPKEDGWYLVFFKVSPMLDDEDYMDMFFWNKTRFEDFPPYYQNKFAEYIYWTYLPEPPEIENDK